MVKQRNLLAAAMIVGSVVLLAGSADAGPRKLRQLRAEVDRLEAKIVQLQSEMQFLMRREAGARPAMAPVAGVCIDPCAFDSDGDGANDCQDVCPCDPGNEDGDGDGAPDCFDPCPDDATDACIDPCRMDSDGDGAHDCEDSCPWAANAATDTDGDDTPDCRDPCPEDEENDCRDPCPLDADGDGTRDCMDPCPWGEASGRPCIEPPPADECRVGGCSRQVCADHDVVTTCEWRDEYACYRHAVCERQSDGTCGWTPSDELKACVEAARQP
jgi:outer membrane murein-binding lipoprotein Lpp